MVEGIEVIRSDFISHNNLWGMPCIATHLATQHIATLIAFLTKMCDKKNKTWNYCGMLRAQINVKKRNKNKTKQSYIHRSVGKKLFVWDTIKKNQTYFDRNNK